MQLYAGTAAPFNFNGLVRHYFLRRMPHAADLQVNLSPKHERDAQSHDIAKRVRPFLVEIAKRRGSRVKVVEIPPGPPVMDTMVAEVYGPTAEVRREVAKTVRGLFETTPGVVDVARLDGGGARPRARQPRPGEGGPQGHPGGGRGRDAGRPRRGARRRPDRRAVLPRARAGAGAALGRGPREPRAAPRAPGGLADGRAGVDRRAGPRRDRPRAAAPRAQGPEARRLRDGRPRGGEGEPRVRHPGAEREARRAEAPRRAPASSASRPSPRRPPTGWR